MDDSTLPTWPETPLPRAAAPTELRQHVLAKVAGELAAARRRSWERAAAVAIALLLVASVALNAWVAARSERQLARLIGPSALPSELQQWAEIVAPVVGHDEALKLSDSLLRQRRATSRRERPLARESVIRELLRDLS